jgi:hypothetical protein
MSQRPIILSHEEIIDKYKESCIEDRLASYSIQVDEKEWDESQTTGPKTHRKTEVYRDKNTRKRVLVRHFITDSQGTRMTVTELRYDENWFMADRIS